MKLRLKLWATALFAVVVTAVALAIPFSAAEADITYGKTASGKDRLIVVDGVSPWPEINPVIDSLRDYWDLPITGGVCTGAEKWCIHVSSYSQPGEGVYAWGGSGILKINVDYDPHVAAARKEILFHEFGHNFGLPHNLDPANHCKTSMAGGCQDSDGFYIHGYTNDEYQQILKNLDQ